MTGKKLMEKGRWWTESALSDAIHLVVSGKHGEKDRRLTAKQIGALLTCVEPWVKPAPTGSALVATIRLDGAWDAQAMVTTLARLRKAGIVVDELDDGAALPNRTGIAICAPGGEPITHHCERPSERFHAVMVENGLTRVELVGGLSEPRSEGAQKGRWSEVSVRLVDIETKTTGDRAWIDPFIHGGQRTLGDGMPESKVMFTTNDNTSIQLRFHGEPICTVSCLDDFTRWCLILRGALATAAAAGCLAAWMSAQDTTTEGSEALLTEVGNVFRKRGKEILCLVDQAEGGG